MRTVNAHLSALQSGWFKCYNAYIDEKRASELRNYIIKIKYIQES